MKENPYEVLEIGEDSSEEDIKKAFRHKALQYHPDKNRNDPKASEKFARYKKAYELLTDTEKKKKYDEALNLVKKTSSGFSVQGQDLKTLIRVSILDVINRSKVSFHTKRKVYCSSCEGTGSSIKKTKKCDFCSGTGLQGLSLVLGQKKKCKFCEGVGFKPAGDPCMKCHGSILLTEIVKHEIKLNPLSKVITLPKMGNYPIRKGLPGDLIVEVEVSQDPKYKVDGLNISTVLEISPAQAILGDEIALNVLGRNVTLKIPQGTQHDDIVELCDGGIRYDDRCGYFKAHIKIALPQIITEEEMELYNKILSLEKGNTSWPKVLKL